MLSLLILTPRVGCVRTVPWVRYAAYALLCGAVYVVGFPLGILVLLFRRRHKLFGSDADPFVATTRAKNGFLYEVSFAVPGNDAGDTT